MINRTLLLFLLASHVHTGIWQEISRPFTNFRLKRSESVPSRLDLKADYRVAQTFENQTDDLVGPQKVRKVEGLLFPSLPLEVRRNIYRYFEGQEILNLHRAFPDSTPELIPFLDLVEKHGFRVDNIFPDLTLIKIPGCWDSQCELLQKATIEASREVSKVILSDLSPICQGKLSKLPDYEYHGAFSPSTTMEQVMKFKFALTSNSIRLTSIRLNLTGLNLAATSKLVSLLALGQSKIESLDLDGISLNPEVSSRFVISLFKTCLFPRLRHLRLKFFNIGLASLSAIISARAFENHLETLELDSNRIGDRGMQALAYFLRSGRLAKLQKLSIINDFFGNAGVKSIASIESLGLNSLELESINLQDDGVISLCEAISLGKCNRLETLVLSGGHRVKLSYDGVLALANAINSNQSKISVLSLNGIKVNRRGSNALGLGIASSRLKQLWLSGTQITADGMNLISAGIASGASSLERLHLTRENNAKEGVLSALADATSSGKSSLKTLSIINREEIRNQGYIAMAKGLKSGHSSLESLTIYSLGKVKVDSVLAFADALKYSQLQVLRLHFPVYSCLKTIKACQRLQQSNQLRNIKGYPIRIYLPCQKQKDE